MRRVYRAYAIEESQPSAVLGSFPSQLSTQRRPHTFVHLCMSKDSVYTNTYLALFRLSLEKDQKEYLECRTKSCQPKRSVDQRMETYIMLKVCSDVDLVLGSLMSNRHVEQHVNLPQDADLLSFSPRKSARLCLDLSASSGYRRRRNHSIVLYTWR